MLTITISSGGLWPPQRPAMLTIIISVRLGAAEAGDLRYYCMLQSSYSERRPIGFRSPSDRIPYAARSDSVRYTMTFRGQKDETECVSDRLVEVV